MFHGVKSLRGALTPALLAVVMLNGCASSQSPPDARGITVMPLQGQPESMSRLITGSLINALIRRGYDARMAAGVNRAAETAFVISGRAETLNESHAPTVATLDWTLADSHGNEIVRLTQGVRGASADWAYGSPDMLRIVGEQTAAELSPFLGPASPERDSAKHDSLTEAHGEPVDEIPEKPASADDRDENRGRIDPVIWVDDVTGAPGTGNAELTMALRRELMAADVPFALSASMASHFVQGMVNVNALNAATEHVEILWVVRDSSGRELGRIAQENDIARGSLHGMWGDTARYAAIGGAQAVLAILEAVSRR